MSIFVALLNVISEFTALILLIFSPKASWSKTTLLLLILNELFAWILPIELPWAMLSNSISLAETFVKIVIVFAFFINNLPLTVILPPKVYSLPDLTPSVIAPPLGFSNVRLPFTVKVFLFKSTFKPSVKSPSTVISFSK